MKAASAHMLHDPLVQGSKKTSSLYRHALEETEVVGSSRAGGFLLLRICQWRFRCRATHARVAAGQVFQYALMTEKKSAGIGKDKAASDDLLSYNPMWHRSKLLNVYDVASPALTQLEYATRVPSSGLQAKDFMRGLQLRSSTHSWLLL